MADSGRRLPPLGALPAFEVAGRLLSFTRAAAELHVTQGAVSRQIRLLEESLGTALFRRRHRAVELTDAGRRLHRTVAMALDQVAEAADGLRAPAAAGVTIAATPAMASFWLIPRLDALRAALPGVEVQVLATGADLDAVADRFDIGIRYGTGRWPGFAAEFLDHAEIVPVCAPGYLKAGPVPLVDLPGERLLHLDEDRWYWIDWPLWLRRMAAGQGAAVRLPSPALRADTYTVLINAALAGQGIALGWRPLIDELLDRGLLTVACEARLRPDHAFYLVSRPGAGDVSGIGPEARAAADWIGARFRATGAPGGCAGP